MTKARMKPKRKLREIIASIPTLHDSDGNDLEVKFKDKNPPYAEKTIKSLPITFDLPVETKLATGSAISLNIWPLGSPIPATKMDTTAGQEFIEVDRDNALIRAEQLAQYVFEMAQAGAVEFKLKGIPKTGLGNVFQVALQNLCEQHNKDFPDEPIAMNFNFDDATKEYMVKSSQKKIATATNNAEEEDLIGLKKYIVDAGTRSIIAKKFAKTQNWDTYEHEGRSFLRIADNDARGTAVRSYEIMSGSVTNFTEGQFVSAGSAIGREIIILNTQSPVLKSKYDELKARIEQLKNDNGGKELSLEEVMKVTIQFIRETLGAVDNHGKKPDVEKLLDEFLKARKDDPAQERYKDNPLIDMDEFIQNKKGVCRHHGLLLAHFLDKLQRESIIPKGRVHHARDNVKGGAHVWVMYQPDAPVDGKDQLYIADSLWNKFGNILDPKTAEDYARGYGTDAINNCVTRFNRPAEATAVATTEPSTPIIDPASVPAIDPALNPIPAPPTPPPVDGGKLTPAIDKPTSSGRTNLTSASDNIKSALLAHYPNWTIDDKDKLRQLVCDENKQPRFTITPAEMKTTLNDIDTFKAMLICYKAANPGKMPAVTAFSVDSKKVWDAAVKEVYKDELAAGQKIEVKISPPLPPPPTIKVDPAAVAVPDEDTPPTPKH